MADFTVRTSLLAKASNAVTGAPPVLGKIVSKQVACLAFDLDGTNGPPTGTYLEMISADANPNGLIIMAVKGFMSEAVVSTSTDAILRIRDGASSPNTIAQLTPTNADAAGDFVDDSTTTLTQWEVLADGTDYTVQHVAAGLKVECGIQTAAAGGTVTGICLVLIEFIQIPSYSG